MDRETKVVFTQEQAEAFERALKSFGPDNVMNNYTAGGTWYLGFKPLNSIRPSEMARAMYVGYEISRE